MKVNLRAGTSAWSVLLPNVAAVLAMACGGQSPASPSSIPSAPAPSSVPYPTTTAPEGDGVLGEWISAGGLKRTYALHVPPACDGSRPCPLILAFHGAGGTHQFAENVGLYRAADSAGFVVAAADGVAGDWALRCGGCTVADRVPVDDVGFVRTLVRQLSGALRVDASRVYATGRSDGASFTYRLACDYPLAGAAVISGVLFQPQACQPARPVPLIAFHGTLDSVIPFNQGVIAAQSWANLNGCSNTADPIPLPDRFADGTTVTRYDLAGCPSGGEVAFFSIEGGGHNWPGSPTPESAGLQTRDVEASEELVDFFARHPLSTTAQ